MAKKPLKFKTLQDLENAKDGTVMWWKKRMLFSDFEKEKDMVQFCVDNIDLFVKTHFEDEVISFEVDKAIDFQHFSPRGRRVDLFVQWSKGIYIIEFKNAINACDIRKAVGQILDYWREFLDPKKQLVIVANIFDWNTAKTITHYSLPIRYIVMSKTKSLEYEWEKESR